MSKISIFNAFLKYQVLEIFLFAQWFFSVNLTYTNTHTHTHTHTHTQIT